MTDLVRPLPWHQAYWQKMTQLIEQGKMSHAWLLTGPMGVGKRHFAQAFTSFLLCENRKDYACGLCRSCQQLIAGHHPNAICLQRGIDEKTGKTKRDISVEQVRDLNERLALSSHYGQAKIAVIDPADAFNANSVNALLKTIEEPSKNSYLLLISERPQALAATLRSRCQRLTFGIPELTDALAWLGDDEKAKDALQQSHGAPLRARAFLDSGEMERSRSWISCMNDIATQKRDPIAVAAILTATKSSAKDDVADFLQWLLCWLTYELRQALTVHKKARADACERMLRETLEAQRRLAGNGVPQLLVESLLIYWWRVNRQSKAA